MEWTEFSQLSLEVTSPDPSKSSLYFSWSASNSYFVKHKSKSGTLKKIHADFLGGPGVKNLPCNARDTSLIPGLERSHMPQSDQARGLQLLSQYSRACKLQPEKASIATETHSRQQINLLKKKKVEKKGNLNYQDY